jgi:hypothetical protein
LDSGKGGGIIGESRALNKPGGSSTSAHLCSGMRDKFFGTDLKFRHGSSKSR